jgi:hypothetical protein
MSKKKKTLEARTPEVNLGHPKQEISHFRDMTLQRILRDMH